MADKVAVVGEKKAPVERKHDPYIQRIREVRDAAVKLKAAKVAKVKVEARLVTAQKDLDGLIATAPEAQRGYLQYIATEAGK